MILAEEFDAFLIDLDGVMYVGEVPVVGAAETVRILRSLGKQVLFITNDPRCSRADYARKLQALGVPALQEDVLTSSSVTAAYISAHDDVSGQSAFVIGSLYLKKELKNIGLHLLSGDEGRQAEFIVVGAHEDFGYQELRIAAQAVRAGGFFYATNRDPTFPMPDGLWPATGSILAAVETASGCTAKVVGKPEPFIFEAALSQLDGGPHTAVVGDSLSSDIVGGQRAGLRTIWVADGSNEPPSIVPPPDFRIPTLSALLTEQ